MKKSVIASALLMAMSLLTLSFYQSTNVHADDVSQNDSSIKNTGSYISSDQNMNNQSDSNQSNYQSRVETANSQTSDNSNNKNSNNQNPDNQNSKNPNDNEHNDDSNESNKPSHDKEESPNKQVKKHNYFRVLSNKNANFLTVIKKNRNIYKNGAYNTNASNIKSSGNSGHLIGKWIQVTDLESTKLGKYAHIINKGKDEGWINTSALDYSSFKLNNVPLIAQRPELPTGCEITALTMMINYATGKKYSKTYMANRMPHSSNPNKGFIGSPYSKSGWYIYPPALMKLVKKYVGSSNNLTGKSTESIKVYLKNHSHPVVIYVAGVDGFPNHALTVTGYTKDRIYYNDPWLGKRTSMSIKAINIHRNGDSKRAISY
ncbi:C39 family peptidase [Apilactobacillus apisilvae]|uniref:C39 family peptidase n=1 Tax=Apilactobacillus apisilvae TaxID=2923364 RepID=A0ABY4PGJ2_9LACO|nr:C39 family peptidase [Apilactobacillus apisilvae]UQS84692.1 C39 family peptidase [Apilactobacillus apisilvae]